MSAPASPSRPSSTPPPSPSTTSSSPDLPDGLQVVPGLCCGPAPWRNLIIEADNLDALRLLGRQCEPFHLVYVDAPYNTGRRDLVFNDRNVGWTQFMRERLQLAHRLLRPDGAMFLSIDDRELFNLGGLLGEIFGAGSFVANCIWQKRYSRENRGAIGDAHEYVLVYSPRPDLFKARRGRLPLAERQSRLYRNPCDAHDTDPARRWRGIPMTAQGHRPNQMYTITAPNGTRHVPPDGRCWSLIEPEFRKLVQQGRVHWGRDGSAQPSIIRYLSEVQGVVPSTWWPHEEVGHTDEARKEIQELFGTQTAFDAPKPVRLMHRILQIGAPESDARVLDLFGGSGTTAHALLQMNQADGGQRRFVLICNRESDAASPDRNLARDVCAARVRRVIEGYESPRRGPMPGLPGDFAYARVPDVAS